MGSPEGFSRNKQNERAMDDLSQPGMHFNNLYDEDEDQAGARIDEATGKQIKNSGSLGGASERLRFVRPTSKDALPALKEEEDEAARWLREHDKGDTRH